MCGTLSELSWVGFRSIHLVSITFPGTTHPAAGVWCPLPPVCRPPWDCARWGDSWRLRLAPRQTVRSPWCVLPRRKTFWRSFGIGQLNGRLRCQREKPGVQRAGTRIRGAKLTPLSEGFDRVTGLQLSVRHFNSIFDFSITSFGFFWFLNFGLLQFNTAIYNYVTKQFSFVFICAFCCDPRKRDSQGYPIWPLTVESNCKLKNPHVQERGNPLLATKLGKFCCLWLGKTRNEQRERERVKAASRKALGEGFSSHGKMCN